MTEQALLGAKEQSLYVKNCVWINTDANTWRMLFTDGGVLFIHRMVL